MLNVLTAAGMASLLLIQIRMAVMKIGQDAYGVVVERQPVDDIVAWVVAQQHFSAREDCHAANDEGEYGCDFIESCVHVFSPQVCGLKRDLLFS